MLRQRPVCDKQTGAADPYYLNRVIPAEGSRQYGCSGSYARDRRESAGAQKLCRICAHIL